MYVSERDISKYDTLKQSLHFLENKLLPKDKSVRTFVSGTGENLLARFKFLVGSCIIAFSLWLFVYTFSIIWKIKFNKLKFL